MDTGVDTLEHPVDGRRIAELGRHQLLARGRRAEIGPVGQAQRPVAALDMRPQRPAQGTRGPRDQQTLDPHGSPPADAAARLEHKPRALRTRPA